MRGAITDGSGWQKCSSSTENLRVRLPVNPRLRSETWGTRKLRCSCSEDSTANGDQAPSGWMLKGFTTRVIVPLGLGLSGFTLACRLRW